MLAMVKEFIIVWQSFIKACNLRCYLQFGTCVRIAILFAPCINMILEVESVADHHHIWHLYCSGCKGIAFWILGKFFQMAGIVIANCVWKRTVAMCNFLHWILFQGIYLPWNSVRIFFWKEYCTYCLHYRWLHEFM